MPAARQVELILGAGANGQTGTCIAAIVAAAVRHVQQSNSKDIALPVFYPISKDMQRCDRCPMDMNVTAKVVVIREDGFDEEDVAYRDDRSAADIVIHPLSTRGIQIELVQP